MLKFILILLGLIAVLDILLMMGVGKLERMREEHERDKWQV